MEKLLAKQVDAVDQAKLMTILLMTGLWDLVSIEDRRLWCTRGEIYDTPGGRLLFEKLRQVGALQGRREEDDKAEDVACRQDERA